MTELRQDRTSGRWVLSAPRRAERPGATPVSPVAAQCPFCPGHEAMLPEVIAEAPSQTPPGWSVRVVPNKYPAMRPDAEAGPSHGEGFRAIAAAGFHEVIVESPRHDADLTTLDDAQIETVVAVYRDRSRHLLSQPGVEAVILFRNRGTAAGASMRHPHAQAVALGFAPPTTSAWLTHARDHHRATGRCATCEEIEAERRSGARIVEETENFLAWAPFAAEHPCEVWIAPKGHAPSFAGTASPGLGEFARLMRRTLGRLKRALDDPPYNFAFDTADRANIDAPFAHWRLRIAPKLAIWGGFELGTGMAINPSSPEADAERLRAAGEAADV